MAIEHADAQSIHKFAYVDSSDPGAVGADKGWVDTSQTPPVFYIRDAGNTTWIKLGGGGLQRITVTGNTNNQALNASSNIILTNVSGSLATITGFSASQSADMVKEIATRGINSIKLVGESASSTAANRFASTIILAPNSKTKLVYNGTSSRWEVFN